MDGWLRQIELAVGAPPTSIASISKMALQMQRLMVSAWALMALARRQMELKTRTGGAKPRQELYASTGCQQHTFHTCTTRAYGVHTRLQLSLSLDQQPRDAIASLLNMLPTNSQLG